LAHTVSMITVWRKENEPESTRVFVTVPKGLCCCADVLIEFVGPLAIYGDVNDILQTSMSRMKDYVETTNLKKLQASRQAERKAAEKEQAKRQKKLHKVHGSGAATFDAFAWAAIVATIPLTLAWWCGNYVIMFVCPAVVQLAIHLTIHLTTFVDDGNIAISTVTKHVMDLYSLGIMSVCCVAVQFAIHSSYHCYL